MTTKTKTLTLQKETIRTLTGTELDSVQGGQLPQQVQEAANRTSKGFDTGSIVGLPGPAQ
jgi:hypothetical protein